ncbi:MAG: hypothetical protein RIR70_757 [Pseudomonadota bacterium]|jgi:hypothetical protein
MAGGGNEGGDSYWPAFVDALANLVLALIFVVVVFTLALAYLSSRMAAEQAKQQLDYQRKASDERELDLLNEIARLKGLLAQMEKRRDKGEKAESATLLPKVMVVQANGSADADMVFTFEPGALELSADALGKLDAFMKGKGANSKNQKFNLIAVHSSGAFSQEKRFAYFRLLGLRNALIDRGVPSENIGTSSDGKMTLPGLQGQVRLNVGPN